MAKIKNETVEQRLNRLVSKVYKEDGTLDNNACWLFTGCVTNYGYGKFTYKGVVIAAHRLALETRLGRGILKGKQANHINDCNKLCCNPDHIYEGTRLSLIHI